MPERRRPRPLPTQRGLPRANSSVSELSECLIALAAPTHIYGTRRYERVLAALHARFPESILVAAETADIGYLPDSIDRLVFMVEGGGFIDEGVFRAIHQCDEAGVPVSMLAHAGRLIARDRLGFSFYERSTPRCFARGDVYLDSRVNPRAWG